MGFASCTSLWLHKLIGSKANATAFICHATERGHRARETQHPGQGDSRQAKAIADTITPFIRLPSSIERAAQNAIHMRKPFTARFLQLGVELGDSNAGHLYFVDILQESLGLLKSRYVHSYWIFHPLVLIHLDLIGPAKPRRPPEIYLPPPPRT
jgi:hypothetical protein